MPGLTQAGFDFNDPPHPIFQFQSSLVGSYPGITAAGIPSAGASWTLTMGKATLSTSGMLTVDVDGLVL
jgi:hypothetical protein